MNLVELFKRVQAQQNVPQQSQLQALIQAQLLRRQMEEGQPQMIRTPMTGVRG